MQLFWQRSIIVGVFFGIISCRTPSGTNESSSETLATSQVEAPNANLANDEKFLNETLPIAIRDLRYKLLNLFPLTILITEESLKPVIEKLVAESPDSIKLRPNKDVKDTQISNITVDLKDQGAEVNFKAKFKFRKCAGKACGWWQTVHTTNRLKFKFSIEDWILRAELADVKVFVDEDILNAFIGKYIKKDVSEEIIFAANELLPQASGRDLKEQLKDKLSDYVDFVTDFTVFDVSAREDGLLLVVKNEFIKRKPFYEQSKRGQ